MPERFCNKPCIPDLDIICCRVSQVLVKRDRIKVLGEFQALTMVLTKLQKAFVIEHYFATKSYKTVQNKFVDAYRAHLLLISLQFRELLSGFVMPARWMRENVNVRERL